MNNNVTAFLNIFRDRLVIDGISFLNESKTRKALKHFLKFLPKNEIREVRYIDAIRFFGNNLRRAPYFYNRSLFAKEKISSKGINVIKKLMSNNKFNVRIELMPLQGKVKEGSGSFAHRDAIFWLQIIEIWANEQESNIRIRYVNEFYNTILKYLSKNSYMNCPEIKLGIRNKDDKYLKYYYGKNVRKLIRVKNEYDYHNTLIFQQSIPLKLK